LEMPPSQFITGICVAVNTAVGTCIVCPDVLAFHAATQSPLSFVLGQRQIESKQASDQSVVDTFAVTNAKVLEVEWLGTGEELETVFFDPFREKAGQFACLFLVPVKIDEPHGLLTAQFSHPLPCFSIDIEETDHAPMGQPAHPPRDGVKATTVIFLVG